MADLKISQLPSASSLANTDLIPVKTTAGTKAITFENLKGSQEGYFKRIIAEYMQFDYEDLKAMRADGELIAGQKYLLTDYQTVYRQDRGGTYVDKVSDVEPLILTAVSTTEFSQVAYSPSYPQDTIWYNFDNELSPENTTLFYNSLDRISKGFKGIILRRIDTQKNIDYSYDWRTMLWWREGNEVLTFADLNSAYNIVSGSNCYDNVFGSYCYDNTFGSNCYSNTFGSDCYSNTFGDSCYNNKFNGNYCSNNTFGNNCFDNTLFGNYCQNNTFGNSCSGNTFGNSCSDNTFGNYCQNNTFGNVCSDNTFGNSCYDNTFGDFCSGNTFGDACFSNTFGNNCFDNMFGNACYVNTFSEFCRNNTFGCSCSGNTFGVSLIYADVKNHFSNATVTNPAIYDKEYNHTFYVDSSGNKKCYCITNGEMTDIPLEV